MMRIHPLFSRPTDLGTDTSGDLNLMEDTSAEGG